MHFDWDDAKNEWTLRTRGFDFDFISQIFDGDVLRAIDCRADYGEIRTLALGEIEGRVYVVGYTMREPNICRIFSGRKANARETHTYRSTFDAK
jgi:uncharacterized DUF497 family protein